jgi:hypothetical protein
MIEALASLISITLERLHYAQVCAQDRIGNRVRAVEKFDIVCTFARYSDAFNGISRLGRFAIDGEAKLASSSA